ncbi:hypothetical protein LNP17_26985 [Klebsiella variicola subsp. variicola]|nr:hypothetical protein [Klebsiella variicola subsp. variicola]
MFLYGTFFAEDTVKSASWRAFFSSVISGGQDGWRSGWEKIFADFLPAAGEKKAEKGDGKGIMRQMSGSGSQS